MTLLIAALIGVLPQAKPSGKAPTPDEAFAWLKSLDTNPNSAQKQPRFPSLTVEDLKTLKDLRLGGHRASDGKYVFIDGAGLRFLTALPALEKLNLDEVEGLSDDSMAYLGKIATLKELYLGDAWITSAGLKHFAGLKELTRLQIGWTKDVGDAGLPFLARLTKLEFLGLGGTKVTDAGLPALAALPSLKELGLPGTAVSDRGLMTLSACKNLTTLNLNNKMKVTQKGIDALKKSLPNLTVVMK